MTQKIDVRKLIEEMLPTFPAVFTAQDVVDAIGISYRRKGEAAAHLWRMVKEGKLYPATAPLETFVEGGRLPFAWTADPALSKTATLRAMVDEAIKRLPTRFSINDLLDEMHTSHHHLGRVKSLLNSMAREGVVVRTMDIDLNRGAGRPPVLWSADPTVIAEETEALSAVQRETHEDSCAELPETLLDPHSEYDFDQLLTRVEVPTDQEAPVPFTEKMKHMDPLSESDPSDTGATTKSNGSGTGHGPSGTGSSSS